MYQEEGHLKGVVQPVLEYAVFVSSVSPKLRIEDLESGRFCGELLT